MRKYLFTLSAATVLAGTATVYGADSYYPQPTDTYAPVEPARERFYSGNWSLTVGAALLSVPEFDGSKDNKFIGQPLISLSRQGGKERFSSRNDNISLGLIDTGNFRAGPTGKLIFGRDHDDEAETRGMSDIDFGGELGVFAEFYPTEWMRVRGEVRHGIVSHDGIVADLAVDGFVYLTPALRLSGGPRATYASSKYFDAYYGVNAAESAASGLSQYDPGSGFASYGVGGALTWDTTDKIQTSVFGEYRRLTGPAEDSSLVQERGDRDQFTLGVSATYRFDFSL